MFVRSPAEGAFHQGEILSDVIQLCALLDSLSPESEGLEFDEVRHPFAVVLTQECDLDWDFKARTVEPDESKRQLKISPNVLFCELFPESVIRPRVPKGSEMWKRITNNQDQRYHTITPVPSGLDRAALGLPMLIADFKQVFAVRTDELYHRLGLELRRRTIIQVPWVQDLSNRFSYYFERVALPEGTSNQIALPASSASTGGSEIGFWRRLARRLPFRLL